MNELYEFFCGESVYTATVLTAIQLSSAYLRYLSFEKEFDAEKLSRLKKYFLLWTVAALAINLAIFSDGVSYRTYKMSLATGWTAYFIILWLMVGKMPQQIFVLGMQVLWSFMLHAFSGITLSVIYGSMTEELLPLQVGLYLVFFAALLKWEREFFTKLLPAKELFEDKLLSFFISILPLAIFIGAVIPVVEMTFMPTWREKFSRLFFPIFFLLMYRSTLLMTRQLEEKNLQKQKTRILSAQMENLSAQNKLMTKNQSEAFLMRKNLLKNYLELEKLLINGQLSEAKEFIGRQGQKLDLTRVKIYSRSPLINAAISIYSRRAEKLGIKISCMVDLPEKVLTDDSDLAVLISNLLENAIAAVLKQKPPRQEISLIIRNKGRQNILEVTNNFDKPIKLGENGLPYTTALGHGLGMSSLELFAKKYEAFYDFSQENGIVRVSVYWNDYL